MARALHVIDEVPCSARWAHLATTIMEVADNPGVRLPYRMMKRAQFTPDRMEQILVLI